MMLLPLAGGVSWRRPPSWRRITRGVPLAHLQCRSFGRGHRVARRACLAADEGAGVGQRLVADRVGYQHAGDRGDGDRAAGAGTGRRASRARRARSPSGCAIRADSRRRRPPSHGTRMRRSCRCSACDLRRSFLARLAGSRRDGRVGCASRRQFCRPSARRADRPSASRSGKTRLKADRRVPRTAGPYPAIRIESRKVPQPRVWTS